jgi:hypothetical protein
MTLEDSPVPVNEVPPEGRLAGIGNLWRAGWSDFRESEQKPLFIGSTMMTIGLGAIGAARLPTALIPATTFGVLEHTHSVPETAAAGAVMFGGWAFTAAQTLNLGMSQYPKTVGVVKQNFSPAVDVLTDSLPGWETPVRAEDDPRKASLAARIGSTALTHARRGFTVLAIGATPYVMAARIQNKPKEAIHRLITVGSLNGAAVAGVLSGSVAEVINTVGQHNPELAQGIQDNAGDTKALLGFAGALMITQFAATRRAKRKQLSAESQTL